MRYWLRTLSLALTSLVAASSFAAITTVPIGGTINGSDGQPAQGGSITCTLKPGIGRASDGVSTQVVMGPYKATIGSGGTVSFSLVPNDVITPAGTVYECRVVTTGSNGTALVEQVRVDTIGSTTYGALARVGGPTLTLPTISGTANSMMATDGSGGLVSTPALQRAASGNAAKFVGRYFDWDATGDGTIDSRYCQDYDGDGTLEWADIQSCIDTLCDADSNSTQDGTAIDLDADGTIGTQEKRCGTVYLADGVWTSSTTATERINLKWKGFNLIGAGRGRTIIKVGFTRSAYCATLPTVRSAIIQTSDIDGAVVGATNMDQKGVDDVTLEGFTIDGLGKRPANAANPITGAYFDCNSDGTADAGGSGEGLNDMNIQGAAADSTSDGTTNFDTFDYIERIHLRNIDFNNCDGTCLFFLQNKFSSVRDVTAKKSSEHCFSLGMNEGIADGLFARECGNGSNWVGGGISLGSTDFTQFSGNVITNFDVGAIMGIRFEHADNRPTYPLNYIGKSIVSNGIVHANDTLHTGATELGYGIWSNTCATCPSNDMTFSNITIDSSAAAVYPSQYDVDWTFDKIRVLGASYDNPGANTVNLYGTRTKLINSDIGLVDYASDGTFDSGAAVWMSTCVSCVVRNNYIRGTPYASATYRNAVTIDPAATFAKVEDNQMDMQLDSTASTTTQGVFVNGADDATVKGNLIRFSAAAGKIGVLIGQASDVSLRTRVTSNDVRGGANCYYENGPTNSPTHTVGTYNSCAPTYVGSAYGYNNYYSTASSVWNWNSCQSPDSTGCYRFNGSTTTIGNTTLRPLTGVVVARSDFSTSVNNIEFAGDLNFDNTPDSGIYLGGGAMQTIDFEGSTYDGVGNKTKLTITDPTAARTITLPNTTGKAVVTSGAAASGGFIAWATGTITCTNVCTAAASFNATACDFAYHVNTATWALTGSTCGDATNETKQCICR